MLFQHGVAYFMGRHRVLCQLSTHSVKFTDSKSLIEEQLVLVDLQLIDGRQFCVL